MKTAVKIPGCFQRKESNKQVGSPMQKKLFRKAALDNVSSPDRLDTLVQVTDPKSWLMLIAFALLLVVGLLWAIWGQIPNEVSGSLILLGNGGVKRTVSPVAGIVQQVNVKPGDMVTAGDVIVTVAGLQNDPAPIVTHVTGQVVELTTDIGEYISEGKSVAYIEPQGSPGLESEIEGIMFVSQAEAAQLAEGMPIKISPVTSPKEENGFLLGRVTDIGRYPLTNEGLLTLLGSQDLVNSLISDQATIAVRFGLDPDASNPTGYSWTSSGSGQHVAKGTLGEGFVVFDYQRPIEIILSLE